MGNQSEGKYTFITPEKARELLPLKNNDGLTIAGIKVQAITDPTKNSGYKVISARKGKKIPTKPCCACPPDPDNKPNGTRVAVAIKPADSENHQPAQAAMICTKCHCVTTIDAPDQLLPESTKQKK